MKEHRQSGLKNLSGLIRRVQDTQPAETGETGETPQANPALQTFLIVGLGNPGREYANTRHNIGFIIVDRLAERLGVSFSRIQHKALVSDGRHTGRKLILAKPQTYMNLSGQAVGALAKFHKIPLENILVVFDEMDLPLGEIRLRPRGGSSGQKGMKSIIERFGNQEGFPRLRMGIGRPPGRMPPPDFLLQGFSRDEQAFLAPRLDDAADAILLYVTDGLEKAMNRYNGNGIRNQ
jgi:PTH1 family peptidyl-tRNA hydrolase